MTARRIPVRGWVTLGLLVALLIVGRLTAGEPREVLRKGDELAALVADGTLVTVLVETVEQSENPDPAGAAYEALTVPGEGPLWELHSGIQWLVGERDGPEIPVVVYRYYRPGSFLPYFTGGSYWGKACRVYTADTEITVTAVTCPEDIPEGPPGRVGGGGNY